MVRQDREGEVVLLCIALDGREGVVAVPDDTLVDGKKVQVEIEAVPCVERGEHGCEDRGVFSPRGADGDGFPGGEERGGLDRVQDLGFERGEKVRDAEGVAVFGPLDFGGGGAVQAGGTPWAGRGGSGGGGSGGGGDSGGRVGGRGGGGVVCGHGNCAQCIVICPGSWFVPIAIER